jgi:RNA polymerase sigma-70 factor, ECF subfamily
LLADAPGARVLRHFALPRKPPDMPTKLEQSTTHLSDNQIVERILAGDTDLYHMILQRYSRRLYRVTWAIVQDEHEADDVVQETYVRAYEHLAQFAGRSLFSTWLTRIAIHEAWHRMKRRRKQVDIDAAAASFRKADRVSHTPEQAALAMEARTILEKAIGALPEAQRSVFVMHFLEEMSAEEIADCLEITEEAVKMRFMRARQRLRRSLYKLARATDSKAFQFLGEQCDRATEKALSRIIHLSREANAGLESVSPVANLCSATTRANIESDRSSPLHSNRGSGSHHSD